MKIVCNVRHKGGTIWEIEHAASIVARRGLTGQVHVHGVDNPKARRMRRSWIDVSYVSSISIGPAEPEDAWWCIIYMKSGEGHSFYTEYETTLAALIDAWRVHSQFGTKK